MAEASAEISEERSMRATFTVHAESCLSTGTIFAREAIVDFREGESLPFIFYACRQAKRRLFPKMSRPGLN
jgi:hypothetical protein